MKSKIILWISLIIGVLALIWFGATNFSIISQAPEAGFHLSADGIATYEKYTVEFKKTTINGASGYKQCGAIMYVNYDGQRIFSFDKNTPNRCTSNSYCTDNQYCQEVYNYWHPNCGSSEYAHFEDFPTPLYFRDGILLNSQWSGTDINYIQPDQSKLDTADFIIERGQFGADSTRGCYLLGRSLVIQPPVGAFSAELIDKDNLVLFQGLKNTIQLKVTNNWREIEATMLLNMKLNTAFGSVSDDFERDLTLLKGDNIIDIEIPTQDVTNEMVVSVYVYPRLPTSVMSGVQVISDADINSLPSQVKKSGGIVGNYIYFGEVYADTFIVTIDAKPLYLPYDNNDCTTLPGYVSDELKSTCLRDDIKDLSCVQRGCPKFDVDGNDANYICTSTGICAQTVYGGQCIDDEDCLAFGAVCKGDYVTGERACVKSEIVEVISEVIKEIPTIITDVKCEDFNPCDSEAGYTCQDQEDGFVKCILTNPPEQPNLSCDVYNPCDTNYYNCITSFNGLYKCVLKDDNNLPPKLVDALPDPEKPCNWWCKFVNWLKNLFN